MSERQVRYWADHGLIAHLRKGNRRLFETVGLITAFSITNVSQHELQFYRGLMEDPVVKLAAKVGILTSVLATRLEGIETSEAEELIAPLAELRRLSRCSSCGTGCSCRSIPATSWRRTPRSRSIHQSPASSASDTQSPAKPRSTPCSSKPKQPEPRSPTDLTTVRGGSTQVTFAIQTDTYGRSSGIHASSAHRSDRDIRQDRRSGAARPYPDCARRARGRSCSESALSRPWVWISR
jgi:hypothetical protein